MPVLANQVGAQFPKDGTPDFTLCMFFRAGYPSVVRGDGNAGMPRSLRSIDVPQCEGILGHVSAIRVTPYPEVIILSQAAEEISKIAAHRVISVQIICGFAEQSQRVEIRPSLSKSKRLHGTDSHTAAYSPAGQAMGVLMERDFRVQASVAIWIGSIKEIDLQARGGAVRWSHHAGVVNIPSVLRVGENRIVTESAPG